LGPDRRHGTVVEIVRASGPEHGTKGVHAAAFGILAEAGRFIASALLVLVCATAPVAAGEHVRVLAAESLREALDEAARSYREASGAKIDLAFGNIPALTRDGGLGNADLVIAGSRDVMDRLAADGMVRPDTRVDLLGNWLVLIAPRDSVFSLRIAPGFPLAAALGTRRLALPDTRLPSGRAARTALENLGVWAGVKDRLMEAPGLRAALRAVAMGEAPLGIVYATDALVDPRVKVLDAFPEESQPQIVYPAALTGRAGPAAEGFYDFLRSAEGHAIFERRGFTVLDH
jgi:molybdate transport system substrate-binding protein